MRVHTAEDELKQTRSALTHTDTHTGKYNKRNINSQEYASCLSEWRMIDGNLFEFD